VKFKADLEDDLRPEYDFHALRVVARGPGRKNPGLMEHEVVIHSNPKILGGVPVFVGTRVPVQTLLDYLEGGESLDTFLDHFPSVQREQAVAVLGQRISDLSDRKRT
jgi:uncharacterized protein (DUF433 family)